MDKNEILILALIIWNICVFLIYGLDKYRAIKDGWRIPEKTLLAIAFLAGGPGALAGMYIFRHKTRQAKFRILVPLAVIILAVAVFLSF